MKYVIWFIIIGAAVGGGWVYYSAKQRAAAASNVTAVVTRPVVRRTIEKIVSANGKVTSNQDVDIKCRASGEIKEMPFDVSDNVKPGELLLQLDTKDQDSAKTLATAQYNADVSRLEEAQLNLQIAQLNLVTTRTRTEASLKSAKAKYDDAKNKAQRTRELFNAKPTALASQEEVETAETTVREAEAQVSTEEAALAELDQQKLQVDTKAKQITQSEAQIAQDKSRLETADLNIAYCTVNAPDADNAMDPPQWRVKSITANVKKGYLVQSGTSGVSGGTTVMTLSDMSHIFVLGSVDESDFGLIAQGGQPVRVTADSYPGEQFEGKVVRVATAGVTTSNVTTFELKIEITSENRVLLRPEMTTTCKIVVSSRPDVVAVPTSAFVETTRDATDTGSSATTAPAVASNDSPTPPAAGASDQPAGRGRRGGRGGGGGGGGGNGRGRAGGGAVPSAAQRVMVGTVQVVKPGVPNEVRDVTVVPGDDDYYEVKSGLEPGEEVLLVKAGADSRFRNPINPLRGIGGGGRGR